MLVFEPEEKTVGYSRLMFGGNVQSDFQSSNTFNVVLSHTWGWLNKSGAVNGVTKFSSVKSSDFFPNFTSLWAWADAGF